MNGWPGPVSTNGATPTSLVVHLICSFQSTVFYAEDGGGNITGKLGPACVWERLKTAATHSHGLQTRGSTGAYPIMLHMWYVGEIAQDGIKHTANVTIAINCVLNDNI